MQPGRLSATVACPSHSSSEEDALNVWWCLAPNTKHQAADPIKLAQTLLDRPSVPRRRIATAAIQTFSFQRLRRRSNTSPFRKRRRPPTAHTPWDEPADLQCAWLLLVKCAAPRAHYYLRTSPPSHAGAYAQGHDHLVWAAATQLLGASGLSEEARAEGWRMASLPSRLGGLGLRSATRSAQAAYWAFWADALPMLRARSSRAVDRLLGFLEGVREAPGCLEEFRAAAIRLRNQDGFDCAPDWQVLAGVTPPPPPPQQAAEVGEWKQGWQFHACSAVERTWRTVLLSDMSHSSQALLRSQSGPGAGLAFDSAPSGPEFVLTPEKVSGLGVPPLTVAIAARSEQMRWLPAPA